MNLMEVILCVVCTRITVCNICSTYLYTGEGRHRRSQLKSCNSNKTVVVVVMAWGMVFLTNAQNGIAEISKRSWLFLILSGLATGASWLCYYRALQLGDASKVVPIDKLSVVITLVLAFVFLHEQFTTKSLIGCILIGIGTMVMVL